eukprot:PITA_22867
MLVAGIIELVEEFDWVSPMVVQEKKQKDEIRIGIDLRKLNDSFIHDPFTTSFIDEVLDNVGGHEAYSFANGFSGYHQIKIMSEDRRPDHLSCIEIGEEATNFDEGLPDAQIFVVHMANNHFADIIHFLTMGMAPKGYTIQYKKELVVCARDFSIIPSHLYKMGVDEIL